jgi:hypothetical protein
MAAYSLSNIIKKVTDIQSLLSLHEIRSASRSAEAFGQLHENLYQQINHLVTGIERNLSSRNLTGAALAIRSRRAYQWLKFLSETDALTSHLDVLQRINLYLAKGRKSKHPQISFSLYHQGSLYKVHHQQNQITFIAQESFLTAPDRILQALIEVALDPASKDSRTVLRDYTFSKEYRRIRTHLEYLGVPPGSFSAGSVHHLEDSFHRVNQTYFQGRMPQPHLVWSQRVTHRKFGHYQWDTDTVMVSKTLDKKHTPEMVVDFIIYHELLHKRIGTRKDNQNRMAHTREFRDAEERFINAEKAKQYLNRIARKGT